MKSKTKGDVGLVNVVQVETMQKLGFTFVKVFNDCSQEFSVWRFDSSGPMAVHGFELEFMVDAQVTPIYAVNHIISHAKGLGEEWIREDIKRVLKLD